MANRKIVLIVSALIIVAAGAVFLFSNNAAPCCAADSAAVRVISPVAYQDQFISGSETHLLVDVRTPEEFASGHIAGAVNIPLDALQNRLGEVSSDQPVVVYCRSGNRSAQAAQILERAGYNSIYDLGGIIAWTGQGFPVQ